MLNLLETSTKVFAWLQIVAAPLFAGGIAGFFIYAYHPHTTGLTMAILTTIIGLVAGIVWANRVKRKRGVVDYMSRVNASPELDREPEE